MIQLKLVQSIENAYFKMRFLPQEQTYGEPTGARKAHRLKWNWQIDFNRHVHFISMRQVIRKLLPLDQYAQAPYN